MKFKLFSLGCKVNSYECSSLASALLKRGYIEDNNDPDVIIVNTCSVTSTADQKSRQHIRKFQKLYPGKIIVVMGCYAQGNKDFIVNEIKPTILVGTSNRNAIPDLIEEYLKTKQNIVKVDDHPRLFCYEELGVSSFSENTRAYLKIQDGCNNFCSYCLIPYRRGQMRSRQLENILLEAEHLIRSHYQEIVLTGIHVGGYGQDLKTITFSDLVEKILDLPNCPRLRISSIEESEIDEKLISLLNKRDNLCKHLHIPLQSGCDETLKRMNRKYTVEQFAQKINTIKQNNKDIMISTDVIVGFPGESEEEFNNTYEFIKHSGINMIHVFPFSAREGTTAYKMEKQIPSEIKNERVNKLITLSKELYSTYIDTQLDKEVDLLIERKDHKNNCYIGRTSNYIEVYVPLNKGKIGDIIKIKLTKSSVLSK